MRAGHLKKNNEAEVRLKSFFCKESCAFCKPYLAPNTPHVRLLSLSGNGGLVLGLVDVGAPLAHIPASLLLVGGALEKHFEDQFKNVELICQVGKYLDLEKSSVLVLVPLTSLVAGEHSLGIQTSCGGSHFLL